MKILIVIVILSCQYNKVYSNSPRSLFSEISHYASELFSSFQILKERVIRKAKNQFSESSMALIETFTNFVEGFKVDADTEAPDSTDIQAEPTTAMTLEDLVAISDRIMESHSVRTDDAYILTLHHLLPKNETIMLNQSVLLHHGLLGSSVEWILLLSEKSLPYLLSDAGYDVWMANARGNQYSQAHESFDVHSSQFWDFSWQEMGQYDLSAIIHYIRSATKSNDTINYIGHSMGATTLLVLLSTLPDYNKYIRVAILLAPLAFMADVKGPLGSLAKFAEYPAAVLDTIGRNKFFPTGIVPDFISNKLCNSSKLFCKNPKFFISGVPREINNWNSSYIARLLYVAPASGSTKTLLHYVELIKSKKFHKYNDQFSIFPLSEITVPMAMFSSKSDALATVANVQKLYVSIANPIEHIVLNNLTHTDFLWDAENVVFTKVLELIVNGGKVNTIQINEI